MFARRGDIAWEITLSGRFHHRVIAKARAGGYRIGAFYVGLESASLAAQRVGERVNKGGHAVSKEDVERRYGRSLRNLAELLAVAELAFVFDNSGESDRGYHRVMRVHRGVIKRITQPIPDWLRDALRSQTVAVGAPIVP